MADVGGWTDTWFAGHGAVCSVAVGPGARAEVRVVPGRPGPPVRLRTPDLPEVARHPVLDHAVAAAVAGRAPGALGPEGVGLDVEVRSAVPPGSSVGTSAAVLVALVAALDAVTGGGLDADAVARSAFHVETVRAGRESGVQDHVAAAHGGVGWIEVEHPTWRHRPVGLPPGTAGALGRRLVTVHLGGGHDSSALHRLVIARAEAGDAAVVSALAELRSLAGAARDRLAAGDLDGWGAVLTAATAAQARLHPGLVTADAAAVAALARAHGAAGAKVNGAGGAGGTVTLVAPDDPAAVAALGDALAARGWTVLDLAPAPGFRVARA